MGMNAGNANLTGLEAKRRALKIELMQVDKAILEEQEALARIEAKVRVLEKANRQAA